MSREPDIAFRNIRGSELTDDLIDAISRLKVQHWPYPLKSQKQWLKEKTAATDRHIIGQSGDRMVAYLRIAERAGLLAGRALRLAGVGTVVVDPAFRRRGLGTRLMAHASDWITGGDAMVGVVYCEPGLERFYELCGWKVFPFEIVNGDDSTPWAPYPVCLVLDPNGLADGDIAAFGEAV